MSTEDISRTAKFATAGLGGIFGWICIHPANTLAVRMNLTTGLKSQNLFTFGRKVVREEGVSALYKGLSAGITRQIFYATSRFGLFEVFRDAVAVYRAPDIWTRLLTGCLSGGAAALISCPAEVSLVRMANDNSLPKDQRRNYKNVLDAASRIMREEGVATFWRGAVPFVNRAMLVGACQVGTFDQFKATYKGMGITSPLSNVFAAAMTSGLLYSVVTMPFETSKNRMAFQKSAALGEKLRYRGVFQTISTIAKEEGVLSLWSGFFPYYIRCGGHTVFMFLAVDWMRRAMV